MSENETPPWEVAKQASTGDVKPWEEAAKKGYGKVPSPEPMGAAEQFMTGMGDPAIGAKQLAAHVMGSPEEAATVDKSVQEREASITARGGGGIPRVAGGLVAEAPLSAVGGWLGGAVGGMASGGLSGLLEPDTGKNFIQDKIEQSLLGTAFGAAGGMGTKTLGNLIAPDTRPAVAAMLKSGVQLTPGQTAGAGEGASIMGQAVKRAEEALKSVPILGSFIRAAEGRGIESFNKAVLNQALEPINEKLSATTPAGHKAIEEAYTKLGDAYDKLLPKLKLAMDSDLSTDIANIRYQASELPDAQFKQFETLLQNRLASQMVKGPMDGDAMKAVEGALRSFANNYRNATDPAQRQLAAYVDDVRGVIREALIRQNPKSADVLKDIDRGYAMFVRAEQAGSRGTTHYGVFTPGDLLAAIKQQDKTMRKGAFARGDSLMQLYAESAHQMLASKMPDSGTTERLLTALGAGGLATLISPKLLVGGAAGLPYTKAGQKAVSAIAQPGPARQAVGSVVKKAAPYVGAESAEATPKDIFTTQ